MSAFSRTIQILGLNDENNSQDQDMLHALLQYADANSSGSDVLSNPVAECNRRLAAANLNPNALRLIKARLNDVEVRFNAGLIQ